MREALLRDIAGLALSEVIDVISSSFGAAGIENARSEATLLLLHATSVDKIALITGPERIIDASAAAALKVLVERRMGGEPVTRIVGTRSFWTLDLEVFADVLDPRPDSETIIEAALEELGPKRHRPLDILDLGTGSGALLLAVLSECPAARGLGVDLSAAACAAAAQNARRNNLHERTRIVRSRWADSIGTRFDLILSNPPYIPSDVIEGLSPEVRHHDPLLALDGGPDGLTAYAEIVALLPKLLKSNGFAVLELGIGQTRDVIVLAQEAGLEIGPVRKDLAGIERAIVLKTTG